ncbi:PDZ domain-containing protein [Streptomyces sp. NPDC047880]|uniref:PDZ domain-containing protein n=1 Tax=Streptomyces sp. NPDC047880 TaxID=3155626 RepID=UPI003456D961
MEQTALRPKPMPGQDPEGAATATGPGPSRPRPHAARRRGRRLLNVLLAGFTGVVLVLCGIGLGATGGQLLGEGVRFVPRGWHTPSPPAAPPVSAPPGPAAAALGVQVMDARTPGAVVVGLHVPGPAQAAGLVRGDVLLAFGTVRIDTAADLVRAVARVRPGSEVRLTVRHRGGGFEQLTLVPAVAT